MRSIPGHRLAAPGLLLAAALASATSWAQDASPAASAERAVARRALAEHAFLSSRLGWRQRALVYAGDAADGPAGRGELRLHVNGAARAGGLELYLGLGAVGRPGAVQGAGDPLADPYDGFDAARNLRLLGAHLEYVARDVEGRAGLAVAAGRLDDLDDRAQLLLFDGLRLRLPLGARGALTAYAGRRATLDLGLPDARRDAAAQLVAGALLDAALGEVSVRLAYRFEDVHRPGLRLSWSPAEGAGLGFAAQVVAGAREAVRAEGGALREDAPVATLLRLDGDASDAAGRLSGWLRLDVQLGRDPRPFGRGGAGPSVDAVAAAARRSMAAATLDRLFLGAGQPHGGGELGGEWWLAPSVALGGGGWARLPIGEAAARSLQPRVIEGWFGPAWLPASGWRLAAELRLASEDPGTPGGLFTRAGDGVRRSRGLRLHGEVPLPLAEGWDLALRPEAEVLGWDLRGPRVEATDQLGLGGGLLAVLRAGDDLRVAARWGTATLPALGADGLALVHDAEVWVGGRY